MTRVKTPPIPALAMPVVKLLREMVPHPGVEACSDIAGLAYDNAEGAYCPLGLAPWIYSRKPIPSEALHETTEFLGDDATPGWSEFLAFISWVDGPGDPKVKDRMLGLRRID